jgi:ABC-type Fe2+-enterobactin transport system substrate-binding protein
MGKIYQYSVKEEPVSELDWEDCSESQYDDLQGYAPTRIIEREIQANGWDDLWYEFTTTSEYKQSIKALQFRAYTDWLKDNFQAPIKK